MCTHDGVALARCGLQTSTVANRDMPMRIVDESCVLQRTGDDADGRTLHTEHDRQELVAQMEIPLVHPVVRRQEPAGAALLHVMERVTRRPCIICAMITCV